MSRRPPSLAADPHWLPSTTQARAARDLLAVDVRVITPIFGGGARPRVGDPLAPVRGAAIRGQLRFWWRATRGGRFASTTDLFAEEARLWGSTEIPAALEIAVEVTNVGREVAYNSLVQSGFIGGQADALGYALYPAQQTQQAPAALLRSGVAFKLIVRAAPYADAADLQREARAALWAWLTFGGLGARTRRGCGALAADGFTPPADRQAIGDWLARMAREHVAAPAGPPAFPLLGDARVVVGTPQADAIAAWREAVARYRDIRQGRGIARTWDGTKDKAPGRSYWPEPDGVRQHLNVNDGHKVAYDAAPFFPKADLGLPILVQRMVPGRTFTIEGTTPRRQRFASPIIVKPLALADGGVVPLILCLNAPHIWDSGAPPVALRDGARSVTLTSNQLRDDTKEQQTADHMEARLRSAYVPNADVAGRVDAAIAAARALGAAGATGAARAAVLTYAADVWDTRIATLRGEEQA